MRLILGVDRGVFSTEVCYAREQELRVSTD